MDVLYEAPGELIATAGSSLIVLFRGAPSLRMVGAFEQGFAHVTAQHSLATYISFIERSDLSSNDQVRAEMARVVRAYTGRIAAAAIVFDGMGFRATIVRSAITAVHLASKATHPLEVFTEVAPAAAWLKEQPGASVEPDRLSETVGRLRTRLR